TLVLNVLEEPGGVAAVWDYDAGLFDESTIAAMHGHYVRLLDAMAAAPGTQLSQLSMLDDQEIATITTWSGEGVDAPQPVLLHQVFTAGVAGRPDDLAIVAGDRRLTNRELDERSTQLAHWLRTRGIGADDLVGVCLPRGIDLVLSVLAISKAGGGY